MREAMIVTYYPDGTRVGELLNPSRVNDAKVFLGGRKPGELADSALNTVVYQRYGWGELFAKWVVATAAGNPPDVVLHHQTEIAEMVERDVVMSLEALANADGWTWEGFFDGVEAPCYYKGTLYSIIEDIHPYAIYYNVDLVEEAGFGSGCTPHRHGIIPRVDAGADQEGRRR